MLCFCHHGNIATKSKADEEWLQNNSGSFPLFFYLGGGGPIISAIDVYSEDDVSFDGFDDFIEPPVELKMHDNVSGMVYSETLPMRMMNGLILSRTTDEAVNELYIRTHR